MAKQLEFWFDFASPYAYISSARIEDLAAQHSFEIEWKPFLLGPIFRDQGWDSSPFVQYPAKGKYMFDDVARICSKRGVAYNKPNIFPQNSLLPARIAVAAAGEEWMNEFIHAVFKVVFVNDLDISETQTMEPILSGLGLDADKWLLAAHTAENKMLLREETALAKSKGIFGAPSFIADGTLFWGDDRLMDAIESLGAN